MNEVEAGAMERLLFSRNLESKGYIVLHIGAGNEFRFWGADNLKSLLDLLLSETGYPVVLVGGEEDRSTARTLLKGREGERLISLAGEIGLKQLHRLISDAALFIGPDSGPMHIASSTSTPIVAIFGPTVPDVFGPWQARASILERDLECRPCRQRRCETEDFRCLRSTTPEEVFRACRTYLE